MDPFPGGEIVYQLDEHIAPAVAIELRQRGIEVVTAAEADLLGAPDVEVLDAAYENSRVVVTSDRDYPRLQAAGHRHAGIVYFKQGTRSLGELIEILVLYHGVMSREEFIGRMEYG